MFRKPFRSSTSSSKSVATETTKSSSSVAGDSHHTREGDLTIPTFVEAAITEVESDQEGEEEDGIDFLVDLLFTIEDLQNRATSQIFVAHKMADEALELYKARMKMGSEKSASYSLRKYSCSRMRLEQCKSIREQLSEIFEKVDREMHRARCAKGASAEPCPQLDLYKLFMDLQDVEERIDAAAPSATRCNAEMVQKIGEMMMQEDTLREESTLREDSEEFTL